MRTRLKVMLSRAASITPPLSSVVVACSAAVRRLGGNKACQERRKVARVIGSHLMEIK